MYFRRKQSQGRFYLQIVESHRTGGRVRQRVIATLGRLDELESSGHSIGLGERCPNHATYVDAIAAAGLFQHDRLLLDEDVQIYMKRARTAPARR